MGDRPKGARTPGDVRNPSGHGDRVVENERGTMSMTEKCQRCRAGVVMLAPSAPTIIKTMMEDTGLYVGEPSLAEDQFRICIRCHADETTLALHGIDPQPAILWPVDIEHPFTTRLFEIIDEEVEKVVSRRAA